MPKLTRPLLIVPTTPPPAATSTSGNVPQISENKRRHSSESSQKSGTSCLSIINRCCATRVRSRSARSMYTSRSSFALLGYTRIADCSGQLDETTNIHTSDRYPGRSRMQLSEHSSNHFFGDCCSCSSCFSFFSKIFFSSALVSFGNRKATCKRMLQGEPKRG